MSTSNAGGENNSDRILNSAIIDTATKAGALLVFGSLATAFLHDFVFWACVDNRVISYMVVADHIETAVLALAILTAASATLLASGLIVRTVALPMFAKRVPKAVAVIVLFLCLAGGIVFGDGSTPVPKWGITQGLYLVAAMAAFSACLSSAAWVRAASLVAVWVLLTITNALVRADALRSAVYEDVVEIETSAGPNYHYPITGHFVRMIDKGVILLSAEGKIVFVPKEHIFRIDQAPRRSAATGNT